MPLTEALVLPPDLVLVPVHHLPDPVRASLQNADGDFAIARPGTRSPAKLVDGETAALLGEFRQPRTIADAVLRFSRSRGWDPESTLDDALPLLAELMDARLLVPPGSDEALRIEPRFLPGHEAGPWRIVRCVQVLEDTEIYQARGGGRTVALKLARRAAPHDPFDREAAVLELLAGSVSPRLVERGECEGRASLAMEWLSGVDVLTAAAEIRHVRGPGWRGRLRALAGAVLQAYVRLHARGVVHGDVHPRNLLVDAEGRVQMVDFGLARLPVEPAGGPGRGGVHPFFEPEYARARVAGAPAPAATAASDQFTLGALLYLLLTGAYYLDFPAEHDECFRRIAQEPPVPFSRRGAPAWPEVEAVLGRALAKDPADRFPSVEAMAAALAAAADPVEPPPPAPRTSPRSELLRSVMERVDRTGPLLDGGSVMAPVSSVKYGAAGVAYALLRVACVRDDPAALALADLWAERAARDAARPDAFVSAELGISHDVVGRVSPFHSMSGVHLVRAAIAHARGDLRALDEGVRGYVAASDGDCASLDLTLGRASTVLGASLLLEHLEEDGRGSPLHALGERALARVWGEAAGMGPVGSGDGMEHLGAAHGWAGLLYASLRWCRAAGTPLPPGVPQRLDELAACAQPIGRGVRWPWYARPSGGPDGSFMPGWCNGSSGYVPLWTLAHETLREPRFLELARGAAWHAWEDGAETYGSLCCGHAGRAYGLLTLYRYTGEAEWLARATDLADRAALALPPGVELEDSLYKGRVGAAVLAADLERPDESFMPFYEGPR